MVVSAVSVPPPFAWTLMLLFPGTVEGFAWKSRVAVVVPRVSCVGLKDARTPAGRPDTDNVTALVEAPIRVSVTVTLGLAWPDTTNTWVGDT